MVGGASIRGSCNRESARCGRVERPFWWLGGVHVKSSCLARCRDWLSVCGLNSFNLSINVHIYAFGLNP